MNLDRTYTLDSNVKLDKGTVKIEITSYFDPDNGVIGYFEEQDTAPQLITKTFVNNDSYANDHTTKFEGLGILYHDTGKLRLFENAKYPAYLDGEDNIVVEFETQDEKVTNFSNFLTYADNCMFIYDNENEMVIFSEYNNLDYFPLNNYVKVKPNAAYPIGDSNVALFTDKGITYLTRQKLSASSSENDIKYTYSVLEGKPGVSAVAKHSLQTLANDILFLADTGVHALSFGDNITSNERYALERSALINPKLLEHKDLSKAKAISHKNKYYLAIDDKVYVADARYKTSARDQDMSDTFNYEWWVWDNMPVKQWMIINDELCFLTNNGYVAKFTDERVDESINYMTAGDWTGEETTNKIQFNGNNKHLLKDGNKVVIGVKALHEDKTFYIVTDKDTPYTAQFQLKDENDEIVDVRDEVFGNFMIPFYICDLNNVVSEWYTPVVDMGTSLYSKNLIGSTLTFEPDVEGNVKFGYLTRRSGNSRDKESNLGTSDGVDFDNLDFNDFSFSVGFACSRTLKTRVRNYNYIQFRIVSDNDKDCALNNFVVTYTIGRKNKGVR